MIQNNYTLRKRQFRNLSKHINDLIKNREWQKLSREQQSRLTGRLYKLFGQIRSLFTKRELKKVLAGAAMLIGLTGNIQAQDFAAPLANPFSLMQAYYLAIPSLVDIDADGDLDMFVGEYGDPAAILIYYENKGTPAVPVFAPPVQNPFGFSTTSETYIFPAFADIDGDGDKDIVSIGYNDPTGINIYYFENTGAANMPSFGPQQINPFGVQLPYGSVQPAMADMDADGDLDLLVGGVDQIAYQGQLSYFENQGTAITPNFAAAQTNLFNTAAVPYYLFPEIDDLDNDGDLDVFCGGYYGNLYFFENTGTTMSPTFGVPQINPFNLNPVYDLAFPALGDIDADGDLDLFVGEYYGNIQFFENLDIDVAVEEPEAEAALQIFPNPASKQITVQFDDLQGESHLSVINELGVVVREISLNEQQQAINISDLPSGFYMVELKTENEQFVKKLVIK